jgi:hypothetical protein
MPVTNLTHSLNLSSLSNYYLNHPSNGGMSSGYWFYYSSSVANNTIPGKIVPYRWGTKLTTVGNVPLTLEGTIPLTSESLNRQRIFHGSTITRIGPGINDITLTDEKDAFFFYHIGAIAASDTPGYWDRAYQENVGGDEWDYYQYHQHSPNVYASFDNARIANSGYTFINPNDKQFGYLQPIQVSNMGTPYLNILARIHTPSVGGAHNSHNDVELGSSTTKNYQIGGIIPGSGNRYHTFYISANGTQWDVFSRTYTTANGTFTSEVNHGTYNLASPTINITNKSYDRYPVRASAGTLNDANVFIPLIYSGSGNTFDTKIWILSSANILATSEIIVNTLITGSTQRSDVHLTTANGVVNAVVSYNTAISSSVEYYKYSGSAWVKQGTVLTNGPQEVFRIHGFEYNTEDNLFYTLISANTTGSIGNYTGPGVYGFSDGAAFEGYKHVSYLTSSYGFVLKDPLETGHLRYTHFDGSLIFNTGSEPQSVSENYSVLQYDLASPKFIDKQEAILDGDEIFYAGTKLNDGRVVLVGNIKGNPGNTGSEHDLLLAVYPETSIKSPDFYSYSSNENDYFTGVVEDTQRRCLWMTGYTRSKLTQIRDIWVHGYGRALADGSNRMEWKDIYVDTTGSQYVAGNHLERDAIIAAKYNANLELVWQRDITHATFTNNYAYGNCIDFENNLYIAGKSDDKALIIKLDTSGSTLFSNLYTENGGEYASAITHVTKSAVDYFVVPIVSGSSTIVTILDTTGSIVEQNKLSDFIVNKVRKEDYKDGGYFLLTGNDGGSPSKAKFAEGQILASGNMIQWIYTYSSGSRVSNAFDIKNTEASTAQILGSTSGSKYHIVGKDGIDGFITKIVVDDNGAGTYQATKMWGTNLVSSSFTSLTYSEQEIENESGDFDGIITFTTGYTSASVEGEGGNEGLIIAFDSNGNKIWVNTLGHTADEELLGIANDVFNRNNIAVGWSESHSDGRRTFLFRSDAKGFGTANYYLEGAAGMPIYYTTSSLGTISNTSTLTTITTPTDAAGSLVKSSDTYINQDIQYSEEFYNGGITWNMFIAKLDLDKLQTYKNTEEYKEYKTLNACSNPIQYVDDFFTFYQVGTTGDGTADDGNYFGYDILLMTGSNNIFVAGQSSGHIQFNTYGISGAYDYVLAVFDPNTEEFEFYQSGSAEDEEIYAAAELSDGSGSIAFVGRSVGSFATSSFGGYDIFLGIYNPITDFRRYFSFGSILNDRGVNVHNLGNNELAIVYETSDTLDPNQPNQGGFDVGVIKFNYENWQTTGGIWATSSYQFGSTEDEFLSQDGKPSLLLPDGRIVVTGRTLGTIADDGITYGAGDGFIAILDLTDGTYKKYQAGTAGNETGTTVFNMEGGKIGLAGSTDASFTQPNNGIYVIFDTLIALKAKTT